MAYVVCACVCVFVCVCFGKAGEDIKHNHTKVPEDIIMWHAYLSTLYNFYDTYITFMKRKNKHENYRNISVFFFLKEFLYFYFLFIYLFIYLFLAVSGLHICARAFSSCGKRGPLFIAVRGPLTIAASLVAEHKLQTRRLSSCGSRA